MRLRYTRVALRELAEIFSYLSDRNPRAADAVIDRVEEVVAHLLDFPEMGHRTDEPGVRIASLGRYPYLIFYIVEGEEVAVVHVRHAARLKPWE